MKSEAFFVAAALALLLRPVQAGAKDFPEPVAVVDPLAAATGSGLPAGMGAAFEYGHYALVHDDVDSFYFRLSASPVVFAIGEGFALGADFESVLMCGPVPAGDTPATIAPFWMNAMEFQYGLYAAYAPPIPGIPRVLAEYSRTSQHPIAGRGQYSQVTADLLSLGIAPPTLRLGPVTLRSSLRGGYSSLFAFWHSSIAQPRSSWFLKIAAEASLPIAGDIDLVVRAYPDLFIDRYAEALDADCFAEAGIAFIKGMNSTECLVSLYQSRNSELLASQVHPTFEAGFAIRFSVDRAR